MVGNQNIRKYGLTQMENIGYCYSKHSFGCKCLYYTQSEIIHTALISLELVKYKLFYLQGPTKVALILRLDKRH
jgi:hypothetical protein